MPWLKIAALTEAPALLWVRVQMKAPGMICLCHRVQLLTVGRTPSCVPKDGERRERCYPFNNSASEVTSLIQTPGREHRLHLWIRNVTKAGTSIWERSIWNNIAYCVKRGDGTSRGDLLEEAMLGLGLEDWRD